MKDPRWLKLVDQAVAMFAASADERELLVERLRASSDYSVIIAQFRFGASDRVVTGLLTRTLMDLTGER